MPSSSAAAAAAPPKSSRLGLVIGCIVCLLVGMFLGHAITYHWMEVHHHGAAPAFSTKYQAVALNNGAVFYGQLSGYGTKNPVMTDVFYIVSKTDPTTKQVSNILVKRGKGDPRPRQDVSQSAIHRNGGTGGRAVQGRATDQRSGAVVMV